MSEIKEVQELAYKLNLYHLAKGEIDLTIEKPSNIKFLKRILEEEQHKREDVRALRESVKATFRKRCLI